MREALEAASRVQPDWKQQVEQLAEVIASKCDDRRVESGVIASRIAGEFIALIPRLRSVPVPTPSAGELYTRWSTFEFIQYCEKLGRPIQDVCADEMMAALRAPASPSPVLDSLKINH